MSEAGPEPSGAPGTPLPGAAELQTVGGNPARGTPLPGHRQPLGRRPPAVSATSACPWAAGASGARAATGLDCLDVEDTARGGGAMLVPQAASARRGTGLGGGRTLPGLRFHRPQRGVSVPQNASPDRRKRGRDMGGPRFRFAEGAQRPHRTPRVQSLTRTPGRGGGRPPGRPRQRLCCPPTPGPGPRGWPGRQAPPLGAAPGSSCHVPSPRPRSSSIPFALQIAPNQQPRRPA